MSYLGAEGCHTLGLGVSCLGAEGCHTLGLGVSCLGAEGCHTLELRGVIPILTGWFVSLQKQKINVHINKEVPSSLHCLDGWFLVIC